jgi:hypothetical protein
MNRFSVTTALFLLLIFGCRKEEELIQSPSRKADIQRMILIQKQLTANSQLPLWDIFNQKMADDERQALEFLYAYMPLSDLADYPPSFFLSNVRQCLKARKQMPWSSGIPEDIFLHFVLPLRVNNENLDSFRLVMYQEIKERVKDMNMTDAALEINHWCHEKVNYRGTDARTSAPLCTIKKTFGRCGEESTFTVSAMRTAGIPARQVYTPRWAHTDDNHAWVEVWINGAWHYMGACEPEPALNMGWFSEQSRRIMLLHTRVYGRYFGKEEVVDEADRFSELNLTANYAPVKTITVVVKNPDGRPAESAKVEFKLYNYAEFFPIATKYTDKKGRAHLTTGMGDLMIWTSKKGLFNYRKITVLETDTLVLVLNKTAQMPHTECYDIVPPHAIKTDNQISAQKRKENDLRLLQEDSLRNAYMSTFKDSIWATVLAKRLQLDCDTVWRLIEKSYGNWPQISAYLEKNSENYRSYVLALASVLSDKDCSDAREAVLTDHLRESLAVEGINRETFVKYILSPRIDLENLSPWRSFLRKKMSFLEPSVKTDMAVLIRWIKENIRIDERANQHSRAPLTPVGVYNLRVADLQSRDIFFVAVCRTFGIPARMNPVDRFPEYLHNGEWTRASFDKPAERTVQGFLTLTGSGNNPVPPGYYTHFTIGMLRDGHYGTLEFEEGRQAESFHSIPLDTGRYVLISGNRLENGSVLSTLTYFTIEPGRVTRLPVQLREKTGELPVIGKLNLERLLAVIPEHSSPESLATLTAEKNLVVVLLDPGLEPSRHILNDLGAYVDHFNNWNTRFLFLASADKRSGLSVLDAYTLPSDYLAGIDYKDNLLKAADAIYGKGLKDNLPLVILCDKHGTIQMFSAGYKIGIGEQILKLEQ